MAEPFSVVEALLAWDVWGGLPCSTRVPAPMPERFFTVERVGGGVSSWVDRASVAVQAWAPTDAEAGSLADGVRLAALTSAPPPGVHSVRVEAGPYPHYDDQSRRARHQLVLDVACQVAV